MDIYREQLLDHYHHPRGWGLQASASREQRGFNPQCGDEITVQLKLDQEIIQDVHFEARGCVISIAVASLLHGILIGKPVLFLQTLSLPAIEALLGTQLPPARITCGLLALETMQSAVQTS